METQISNALIRVLADVLRQRGHSPEALGSATVDALFAAPVEGRIPLSEFEALLARAIELTGDPALGLHCGSSASESSFGLMSHLVAHSPSLRHGLSLVTQFHGLLIEDVRVALCECMGTARLCCAFDVRVERGVVELIVAGLVRALRAFGCRDDEIDAVCFEHARPAHHPAYRAAFRGAERFGHAFTGVEFAARALDRPHMHWQPELQAFMRAQAERGLSLLSRPRTCAERVRALMSSRRDREAPDMAAASRELGLSVRSLRRRLEEEGTSYRELTQSMLYESACSMLRNPELTLQAIAHALGFADSSTFHRAFLRWSGSTPAAYRAAALHPGVSGLRAPPLRAAAPRGTAQGT